jgi:hypothetical protein
MRNVRTVDTLLAADEEDLFFALGQELHGHPAFPIARSDLIQAGRRWFAEKQEVLRQRICGTQLAKVLSDREGHATDWIPLVASLADLIASAVAGVSPVTVAVLIVKKGIRTLCDS